MLQVAVEEAKVGDPEKTPGPKKDLVHGRDKDKPLNKQLGDQVDRYSKIFQKSKMIYKSSIRNRKPNVKEKTMTMW